MSQLSDTVRAAIEQVNKAYEEASASLEQINTLFIAIPVGDPHRRDVREIREQAVEAKHKTYDVLHDLEVLEAGMQALESVGGE